MKLLSLKLHNFKGIRELKLEPKGKNLTIKGDNGTGKTTIMDANTWVLFGKDSLNRTKFEIKTIGADGQTIHKLDHEVEAVYESDMGDGLTSSDELTPVGTVKLRKVYREHYTKKKGSALAVWDGHDTDYYVNDLPMKAKDYQSYIASLIDEELFKILTNPKYFNEHLDWKKQRTTLIDMCGDITDEEIYGSDKELAGIPMMLDGRSMKDFASIAKDKRAAIDKELKGIPVRIDEDTRLLTESGNIDEIQAKIDKLLEDRKAKQAELDSLVSGGTLAQKKAELLELQNEVRGFDNDIRQQITDLQIKAQKIKGSITAAKQTVAGNILFVEGKELRLQDLRKKYSKVNAEVLLMEQGEFKCATCGQTIPQELKESNYQEAYHKFEAEKRERLEVITSEAAGIKEDIESTKKHTAGLEDEIAKATAELEIVEDDIGALEGAPAPDNAEAKKNIAELERQIEHLQDKNLDHADNFAQTIGTINDLIHEQETLKAQAAAAKETQARIDQLRATEKALAKEFEEIEKQLYLIELFDKAKVGLLEDKINSQFKIAKFKLFREYDNGGIEPHCECMVNGVPYNGGLNNGMQIAVGIDIINRLEKYYGYQAPIYVDNAEAITDIPETKAQQIRMYVSASDPKLRVE